MTKVVFVGEAMLELSRDGELWRLGHGGDTLNTSIHMARAGIATAYLTALGTDPFSAQLKEQWSREGLDVSLVLTHPARIPGLYAITTDAVGERSFTYWRGESAARDLFACAGIEAALASARTADLLGFSLITLAILPRSARARLIELASDIRARGGKVAFDGNFRPKLWQGDFDEARRARDAAIACADIGLPTLDDENAISGEHDADAVARHWRSLGCLETVVKLGSGGCRLPDGTVILPPTVLNPVDTSGAGDAFNAGYLTSRLRGGDVVEAAIEGHRRAGWCIMRRGAIPPRD